MKGKTIVFLFLLITFFLVLFYILNYSTIILRGSRSVVEKSNIDCSTTRIRLLTLDNAKYREQNNEFIFLVENTGSSNINNLSVVLQGDEENKILVLNKELLPGDVVSLRINKTLINNKNNEDLINEKNTNNNLLIVPNDCYDSALIVDINN